MENKTLFMFSLFGKRIQITKLDIVEALESINRMCLSVLFWPIRALGAILRRRPHRAQKKIVVFQIGGIGDHLFTMPLLNELKTMYPGSRISLITTGSGVAIREWDRLVDQVISLQGGLNRLLNRHQRRDFLRSSFNIKPSLVIRLLCEQFDIGVAIGPTNRVVEYAVGLFFLAGVKERLGSFYATNRCRPFVSQRLPQKTDASAINARTLYWWTMPQTRKRLAYDESWKRHIIKDVSWAKSFFSKYRISDQAIKVVIHPAADNSLNLKQWPAERFTELIRHLVETYDAHVFMTGSKDEAVLCDEVKSDTGQNVHNVAGQTSISQLLGLLSCTDISISNDTSTLHLADAAGTKNIIGIFGPTDPRLAAPLSKNCEVVTLSIGCSPCTRLDASDPIYRCKNEKLFECLIDLPTEKVWRVVQKRVTSSALKIH